jgi:ArsR family transcriptional regulator, lead/cadmium/zinc/bismuth-responsive transcriptional repressor
MSKVKSNTCIRAYADGIQIERCKEDLKNKELPLLELAEVLFMTGNSVRLKIMYLLQQESQLCPCDISDIMSMTVPAISQHLKKLREAGLVTTKKSGQTIYYSLQEGSQQIIFSLLNLLGYSKSIPVL